MRVHVEGHIYEVSLLKPKPGEIVVNVESVVDDQLFGSVVIDSNTENAYYKFKDGTVESVNFFRVDAMTVQEIARYLVTSSY